MHQRCAPALYGSYGVSHNGTEDIDNSGSDPDLWMLRRDNGKFSFPGKLYLRAETFRTELWNRYVWDCRRDGTVSMHYKLNCGRAVSGVNTTFLIGFVFSAAAFLFLTRLEKEIKNEKQENGKQRLEPQIKLQLK